MTIAAEERHLLILRQSSEFVTAQFCALVVKPPLAVVALDPILTWIRKDVLQTFGKKEAVEDVEIIKYFYG